MHQRPAEGLAQKDNMTYPWGRWGEREEGEELAGAESGGGGGRRGWMEIEEEMRGSAFEDLTRVHHPQCAVD